jgi:hypothetical protein
MISAANDRDRHRALRSYDQPQAVEEVRGLVVD